MQGSQGCMADAAALGSPRLEFERYCPLLKLLLMSMCGREACWNLSLALARVPQQLPRQSAAAC